MDPIDRLVYFCLETHLPLFIKKSTVLHYVSVLFMQSDDAEFLAECRSDPSYDQSVTTNQIKLILKDWAVFMVSTKSFAIELEVSNT